MAELYSFHWKYIFSKTPCVSQNIIKTSLLNQKKLLIIVLEESKQWAGRRFFFGKWQVFEIFLKILT